MGEDKKAANKDAAGGGDKKKDAGAAAAPQPIVLKVDLHCAGCANKVRKAIKRAPGAYALFPQITGGYACTSLAVGLVPCFSPSVRLLCGRTCRCGVGHAGHGGG